MGTTLWIVDINVDGLWETPEIRQAANFLREGEVIAFPTETVYGLGANATDSEAVKKIFEAKGRPSDNPLIVHIADPKQINELVDEVTPIGKQLIEAFSPGPISFIFKKKEGVFSDLVTAGLDTVAIRIPEHPVAYALLKAAAVPVAAPSANRSGRPSPTSAQHVMDDLNGLIKGVIDGGETGYGLESTVVDCTGEVPVILRPGSITADEIKEVIGAVIVDPALKNETEAPRAPGMKYRHYAPDHPLYLVDGSLELLQSFVNQFKRDGKRVGVIATRENLAKIDADAMIVMGSETDLSSIAHSLYDSLRKSDVLDVDVLLSLCFPEEGVGQAIMNRLRKAAGNRVLTESDLFG
ncbi:MAG TPA: L-threonylcarbamoyladenylate synthase [Bacillus sp. (in: firmicutes)]|uniref:L-threonylcarbamoyladenylate synthase n=1 Tax=Bacillus litorisediminis TaxID=2922713 RepID=UPI001FACF925|nr:L-threonylcarbamoyladenylate synthase [Bacillus litorisediminis]HWO78124.1 L-threonylcarbamoyladenylate synthase [Bacillus sp. (in: firmicutes)]